MSAAKKNAFMLSDATLMMAKFGDVPCFDLNPADHGVGLSEEIAITLNSSALDLTAGIAQAIIDTKRTAVKTSITGTIKEYSAQNLLWSQGLAGNPTPPMRGVLTAPAAGGAVSLSLQSSPIPGETTSAVPDGPAAIPAGSTILIQSADGTDIVFPTKTSADSTFAAGTHTVPIAGNFKTPAAITFPVGSTVWVINDMVIGSLDQPDLFSVKIAGTLSNFDRPLVAVFPKVLVVKGFALSFTHQNYGTMAWELQPMLLTGSEATGRLTEIGTKAPGRLYPAS